MDQSAFYYIDWWVIISAVFPTAVIYLPYPPPSFGEVVKAVSPLSSFDIIQLLALRCCHFVMHGSGLGAHCWPVILFHTSVLLNYLVSGGKFSILWGLYYLCLFVVLFVGSLGGGDMLFPFFCWCLTVAVLVIWFPMLGHIYNFVQVVTSLFFCTFISSLFGCVDFVFLCFNCIICSPFFSECPMMLYLCVFLDWNWCGDRLLWWWFTLPFTFLTLEWHTVVFAVHIS